MSEPVHASASSPPRASSGAASIASGFSQATRRLKLSTPLGQDVLLTECVRGEEGLGLGYVFHIAALSLDAANADSASLGSHTVVIADHNGSFQPNAQASIADSQPGAVMPQDTMDRWRMQLRREFGVFISHLDDFGQAGADTDAGQRRLHGIGGRINPVLGFRDNAARLRHIGLQPGNICSQANFKITDDHRVSNKKSQQLGWLTYF